MRGERRHRARDRARPLAAIAASLALHLLLLALLLSKEPVSPSPRLLPIEVEWRPTPARPVEPPSERPVAPRPAAPPKLPPPAARQPERRVPASGSGGTAGTFRGGPVMGAREPQPRAAPDLRVRWSDPGLAGSGPGAVAGEAGGVLEPPQEALSGWLREQAGRDRVESGLVHPYYRELGKAFLGAWDAERAIGRRGLAGYVAQTGENLVAFLRVWKDVADGYGKTGAPTQIDGASERIKELSGLPEGPARDFLVGQEIRRQLRPAFSRGRVALVRVTQGADGRILGVELVAPSNDQEVDRAAVASVRAAASRLTPPPAEVSGGRERQVTLWEFELEVSIKPPVPTIDVEFDEVLSVTDVRLPLDRRIWKRVRLVAVL